MHKNSVFLAFLIIIACAGMWYSCLGLYKLYKYSTLSQQAPATIDKWFVEQLPGDKYLVGAKYTFVFKEHTYHGTTLFNNWPFINPWAADAELQLKAKQKWNAWFSTSDPSYSSLEKNWPTKECLTASLLWALFLYFVWLGYRVSRQ